jgi:hypothetical protein
MGKRADGQGIEEIEGKISADNLVVTLPCCDASWRSGKGFAAQNARPPETSGRLQIV